MYICIVEKVYTLRRSKSEIQAELCAYLSLIVSHACHVQAGRVLEFSDPTLMFVFMLCFCISTIAQCFLISVFFSRANLAAVCGGFIYFVLYLPYTQLVQFEEYTSTSLKLFSVSRMIILWEGVV